MNEILAKGYWCPLCGYYEDATDVEREGTDDCYGCGCPFEDHMPAKVIEDTTEKEEIAWVLDLTVRAHNALTRAGIITIGQLREVVNADPTTFSGTTLYDIRNIGFKSAEQIKDALRRFDEANKPVE